jgi:predicted nucleotidyltransferase
MEGINWKTMQIKRILGRPEFDTGLVPPLALMEIEENASRINGLGSLILFGSVVRGEASKKSDIDLMMVSMKNFEKNNVRRELIEILRKIEKKHNLEISFSIIDSETGTDPYFSWEVVRDGMLLFCRPELLIDPPNRLSAYALISYSYVGLEEKEKKAANRFIFETENGLKIDTGNKMEYIAPGVIVIPVDRVEYAEKKFNKLGMKFSLLKIWI